MKRLAYGFVTTAFIAGCTNHPSTPTAPSSPPPAVLATVSVTSTSSTATTLQLVATARFSDGTTREVTTEARWESSNLAVALVSGGLVTIIAIGDADVRASYWGITGTYPLHVTAPPPRLALQGIVYEVPPGRRPLAGARVEIVIGPDAGKSVVSDSTGKYRFNSLGPGPLSVKTALDGYQAWQVGFALFSDRNEDMWLTPLPPKDAAGASATARCKDGTWSWSRDLQAACAVNGGIAYVVCPGPFCDRMASVR